MDSNAPDTTSTGPRPVLAAARQPLASFLDHLVKTGVVSKQQAREASEWKQQNPKDKRGLPEILEEVFAVPRDPLRQAVAQYYAFRTISLFERTVRKLLPSDVNKILHALPESTFHQLMKYKLLPYDLAESQTDKIILVTPNPADREIHELARVFPYKRFEVCYMKETEWAEYWRLLTSGKETVEPVAVSVSDAGEGDFEAVLDREIARAKVAVQLDNILLDAVRANASEIHFVARLPRKTDVLFRLDGHLSSWHTIDEVRCEAVAAALKELTVGIDRYERQAVQQGVIQRVVENVAIRCTVSVLPVLSRDAGSRFESIVLRIFREADTLPRLDQLGLDAHTSRVLHGALTASRGLILFSGMAKSGTSMLLTASLRSMLRSTLNVVVVQERVDYIIDGARQVKLNPRLTVDDALDTIVDHDPDVVVLGDVMNPSVAQVAVRLANIGHLVLATLPSRSSAKALGWMVDATKEPFQVAEAVSAVLAQQALRVLCSRCKKEISPSLVQDQLLYLRGAAAPPRLFRAVGCIECKAGYSGKHVVFEALAMTPALRSILLQTGRIPDDAAVEKAAIQDGMTPMLQQALELLQSQSTTVDEVLPFVF